MRIILASGSPRRKELVRQVLEPYGLTYEIIISDIDEEPIKKRHSNPEELVKELSYEKAIDIFQKIEKEYEDDFLVIGGDTIVYFENEFLGKPKDEQDAVNMLSRIQGNKNEVYTGMTVILKQKGEILKESTVSKTDVFMKPMTKEDIDFYIGTKEPMDKAGAYTILGIGSRYIDEYNGDFNTVVGLNTKQLEEVLKKYEVV